jgi:exonuclease SbcC
MLKLKSLKLHDFLSHQDTEIVFQKETKLLLDGQSGSGKSSIFDGILFALYGTSRSDVRELLRKSTNRSAVEVCLESDADGGEVREIRILRTVSEGGKHTLTIETKKEEEEVWTPIQEATKTEKQTWIENLLGCSYLLFVNSVAYVQGGQENFISQSAPKRKEIILEIVKAGDHDKLYEKAKMALSSTLEEKRILEAVVASEQGVIEGYEVEIKEEDNLVAESYKVEEHLQTSLANYSNLRKTIDAFKQIKEDIKLCSVERDSMMNEWATMEEKVDILRQRLEMKKKWEDKVESEDGLGAKKNQLVRKRECLKEEIEETKRLVDECPDNGDKEFKRIDSCNVQIASYTNKQACPSGDKCPYYKNTLKGIADMEEEKVSLLAVIDSKIKALEEWEAKTGGLHAIDKKVKEKREELQKTEEELIEIKVKINENRRIDNDVMRLVGTETEYAAAEKDLSDLAEKISEHNKRKLYLERLYNEEEYLHHCDDLVGIELSIKRIEEQKVRVHSYLERINKTKELLKTANEKQKEKKEHLEQLKEKEKKLVLIKEAFGSKGIKAIAIDYLLPKLEDMVNETLSLLSDLRINLDSQRTAADGEGMVEGLFINVKNESGQIIPIENLSGGERTKITVAFAEALATLQRCGFRLIDEAIMALDQDSLEHFLETLGHLQKKYPQVIAVSHIPEVKETFTESITCVKKDGITTIK